MTKKKTPATCGGRNSTLTITGRNSQRGDGTVAGRKARHHSSATTGPRTIQPGAAQCDREISRSSNFFPLRSCARTQCGCKPRPDQVSEGRSGFRYFGSTFG
jgi:hypothetical protein